MADIGLGGKVPQQQHLKTEIAKDNEKIDRIKSPVKDREGMAGAKQVESKHAKEEVTKSENIYKAYKKAYEYLLGEEPGEIDEGMESAPLEEEEEVKKTQKKKEPSLEEIERYEIRDRFKAKLRFLLGADFDEDATYEEEELVGEEKLSDNGSKIELARKSYNTLIQYIADAIGAFDFDKIEDIKLFLDYGMPEAAVLKLLFLHQMARSTEEFPNMIDMSILLYKCSKIDLKKTPDELTELINTDYETYTKLKYTLASFIYIPLQEVLNKIEEDIKNNYINEFTHYTDFFELPELETFRNYLTQDIVAELKNLLAIRHREIVELDKNKEQLILTISKTPTKNREEIQLKINEILEQINICFKNLTEFELKVAKFIYIYSFINSENKISQFNSKLPTKAIKNTLRLLGVRIDNEEVNKFLNKKVSIHTLKELSETKVVTPKRNTDIFDIKVKAASIEFGKQSPVKQQQIIKNLRTSSFDANSHFYWLKQKNLTILNELSESLSEN